MELKRKPFEIRIETSHYECDDKKGKAFYSVSCDQTFGDMCGRGSPCDSKEEVIETIVDFLKERKEHILSRKMPKVKIFPDKKTIDFENTTELKEITLEFLLAKANGENATNLMSWCNPKQKEEDKNGKQCKRKKTAHN